MSMDTNVGRTEWKPQATTGNHSQREMAILSEAPPAMPMQMVPHGALTASTFSNILAHAALQAGLDHEDIAEAIHISKGYMSRFMNGVAQQWARRLIAYMRKTGSLAPLQWIADQMGCDVTLRSVMSAELAEARARVAELERMGRIAA